MNRIQSIDFVKLLALSLITILHFPQAREEVGFEAMSTIITNPLTNVAMPLFFMVSGYLMYNHKGGTYYGWKKIWNILKFCFVVCTSATVLRYVKSGGVKLEFFFPNCFLFKGWFYFYWYLGSMMIIYAILPWLKIIMTSSKLLICLVVLGVVCTTMFVLSIVWPVEEYVTITFRLWCWLFYFLLGAFVCKSPEKIRWIRWYYVIPFACMHFFLFQVVPIGYNYFYCSPVCMMFTLSVFCAIINTKIHGSKIIGLLSNTFLPVYTFHIFIALALCKTGLYRWIEQVTTIPVAFCIEAGLSLITCYVSAIVIMRIPYAKKIFRL